MAFSEVFGGMFGESTNDMHMQQYDYEADNMLEAITEVSCETSVWQ